MIQSAEEFVRLRLSQDSKEYYRASDETAPYEVWMEVIYKYPKMKKWVGHNKKVPLEILKILSDDPDRSVRHMVATRRAAGEGILTKLALDEDETVRLRVACNPKVTKEILLTLLNDKWERVVEVAKEKLKRLENNVT